MTGTEPHSLFDRVAIAFGATIIGVATALVVAFPVLWILTILFPDADGIGSLLFREVPILMGLVFGFLGLANPRFAADWLGKSWSGVVFIWRSIFGV